MVPPAVLGVHLHGGPHAGVGAVLLAGPAHHPLQGRLGLPPGFKARRADWTTEKKTYVNEA